MDYRYSAGDELQSYCLWVKTYKGSGLDTWDELHNIMQAPIIIYVDEKTSVSDNHF